MHTKDPHSQEQGACVYHCPYEGTRCVGGKHCHVIETAGALPIKITVYIKCPMRGWKKNPVDIGARGKIELLTGKPLRRAKL